MPKSSAGEMVVLHFDDQLRPQGVPLVAAARAPPTGASRRTTCESRCPDQGFDEFSDFHTFGRLEAGCKADMMKQSFFIVES